MSIKLSGRRVTRPQGLTMEFLGGGIANTLRTVTESFRWYWRYMNIDIVGVLDIPGWYKYACQVIGRGERNCMCSGK